VVGICCIIVCCLRYLWNLNKLSMSFTFIGMHCDPDDVTFPTFSVRLNVIVPNRYLCYTNYNSTYKLTPE